MSVRLAWFVGALAAVFAGATASGAPALKNSFCLDCHDDKNLSKTNAAGQQLYWDVLAAGQTKEFTDSSRLDVTLGDAAGVALQLNGKALPLAGTDGQVVTASFGPTGQL